MRAAGRAGAAELDYEIDGIVIKVDSFDQQRAARRPARAAALGAGVQVGAVDRDHDAQPDPHPRRADRRAQPVGRARAGAGRRRHRLDRDAAQRGGHQPQGHPRGRPRDRAARRRRDPAGRRARPASTGPARCAWKMPTHCPLCGVEVVKPEGEVKHRCPNRACPSRGLETLIHWVSAAMDIEGVGEQFVRKLWDEGLLRSMPDLYRLTRRAARSRSRATARSRPRARSRRSSARRQQPFSRVLFGLNMPKVGWVLARNLARHFGTVDALMAATQEELEEAEGIGPDRAELIAEWFADDENRALVEELRGARAAVRGGGGGAARRGAADGPPVRDHRHARGLQPRGGEGGARGARREGLGLGLEEDDRA